VPWSKTFALLLLLVALAGCGRRTIYPVHGRVVDADGEKIEGLAGGAVEFESVDVPMSANGVIDGEGKFRLTTKHPGDGAHLGKHRVMITRPYFGPDTPAPHVIHPRYESPETSGLSVVVEPKDNEVVLKVERHRRQ
jgi:hypothetical protein